MRIPWTARGFESIAAPYQVEGGKREAEGHSAAAGTGQGSRGRNGRGDKGNEMQQEEVKLKRIFFFT